MKLIDQSYEILQCDGFTEKLIELAGRTCYKSEEKITPSSAQLFVKMLINRGHDAMIEFGDVIVKFITNRGVTHELVRHRLCSFAQESTRYVNYGGEDIEFIRPVWISKKEMEVALQTYEREDFIPAQWFLKSCEEAESTYAVLLEMGWRPEQAREVLPNALKTEIVVKANVREWRHIFKLRCSKKAHPQMRELMRPLLIEMKYLFPAIFNDIYPEV